MNTTPMTGMIMRRVLVSGWKSFARGGAVSVATVLIMTVTLGIIAALMFLSALLTYTLGTITDKVDISVYFVTSATEKDIFAVKDQVEKLPQVSSVYYTSAEEALVAFRERHANDQTTLQALDELGENPLDASLNIRAKDPTQYESVVKFLEASPVLSVGGASIVDHINYVQNKEVIDRLSLAIRATREIGFVVTLFFAIASVLIAFATVRLAIYTAKDEIAVMRLVGAHNAYIQGPFVVTGVITGMLAGALVLILLWPLTWYAGVKTTGWFSGFDIATYYSEHFFLIAGVIIISGIALAAVASLLAIRKYLKV
jgi:cell division transport system permease protein